MNEISHAIVVKEVGKVETVEFPSTPLPDNRLLVKTEYVALCTYEQRVYKGIHKGNPLPLILGHEISGEIVEIGKDLQNIGYKPGDKVVVGLQLPCGHCYHCLSGNSQCCETFDQLTQLPGQPYAGSGGLSEYMIVEPTKVFPYYNVSAQEACMTEPTSCVLHSVESADPQLGDYAVVIGAGMMGLLHTQIARLKGCIVIVIDMNEERLQLAKELGAAFVINPEKEDAMEKIKEYTHGLMADEVFDTTPIAKVVESSMDYLGQKGKLVIYSGIYPNEPITVNPHRIHKKATQLIGSANANERDFLRASKLISNGLVNVKPFISGIYEAEDANEAFKKASEGGLFRNIIHMNFK